VVTDPLTVRFTMERPWATWPIGLTGQAGVLPAPEQLDADPTTSSSQPIGTGPFIFQEWVRDSKLVVKKNPNYWRQGLPYLDEVEYRPITDVNTRFASLQTGDINIMTTSAEPVIQRILDEGRAGNIQVTRSTGQNDDSLVLLNVQDPVMQDKRVRQAMAYAI